VSNPIELVSVGNALKNGKQGWFVGQFVSASFGLVRQQAVEIKWAQHKKGERRPRFGKWPRATTISILVNGYFVVQVKLPDGVREIVLASPGDYVAFAPGVYHSWKALEDCLVITVRFPSVGDAEV
jgi:cupin superfamily acireductone dioxygenase involved in methionine salvage